MKTLSTEFRRQLERTVVAARDIAEAGAKVALEALAVQHHEPYGHMDGAQRTLRRRLRAHARQLGDRPDARSGGHGIDHLVHECAYEHWHGMLFARFLAENHLLIEPEMDVAITLDECEELAKEAGIDKWALAARFAHRMLPQVFRPDHPVFVVQFAREHRLKLEKLVEGLSAEMFLATDALGWVYQFWQTRKKGDVNAAGNKIGADELPAVTQLFTEDYMVDFLLDNTLGAWHAGRVLAANPKLADTAQSEDELRRAVSLPRCPWEYLRFIKDQGDKWVPVAGKFDCWPKAASALKVLDPCMGSGHFLVAMFERLVALRMNEESLDEQEAVSAVIRDNIYGLELDPRCTQIAAFNVALVAWRRVGHCGLPAMNLACSGIAPNTRETDWVGIAGNDQNLKHDMERLYRLFKNAPVLGSLINPRVGEDDLFVAAYHKLQPLLESVLAKETNDDPAFEMAVTASGLAKAAEILASQFTLVATNVPYLKAENQGPELKEFIEVNFNDAKADLATAFVRRWFSIRSQNACLAVVLPQNWLSQPRYLKFRDALIEAGGISCIARLGPRAFQSITGEVVNVLLGVFAPLQAGTRAWGLDTTTEKTPDSKKTKLLEGSWSGLQLRGSAGGTRDNRISFLDSDGEDSLASMGRTFKGITSNDDPSFLRCFWELDRCPANWEFHLTAVEGSAVYGGRSNLILFEGGSGRMRALSASQSKDRKRDLQGNQAWGKRGIAISLMGSFPVTPYCGEKFDTNVAVFLPTDAARNPALFAYFSDPEFATDLRSVDGALKLTNSSIKAVSFDLVHWQEVAAEKYRHGLPKPFSSNPTQWLFNGHPAGADQPLHVAVARLLGYQWPRQTGSSFPDCPALGLDGLEKLADSDGIVCIPAVRGERPAHEQVLQMLQAAYAPSPPAPLPEGEGGWNDGILAKLLADTGSSNLDDWLRDGFFEQHCKLFHHRPFIWHIWDGRKRDGFHALVNYHKIAGSDFEQPQAGPKGESQGRGSHKLAEGDGKGRRLLESLTYSYLGDWITRQQDGVKRAEDGAEDRLAAALELQKRLVAILEGEPPFDIFVRWKPIEEQPIGWEPDINDGVRLNIRPFMAQDIPGGKKGAGILRTKPNIHWKKDRGKEPLRDQAQFPWFWKDGKFTGERVNDVHLSNAEKQIARERVEGKSS
ncbi:Eco57I restriction-modification methylase domain-containing protein [Sedimenticola selenatireducens]|uniref:Eco57I restriction-modification methylase domain-containing protein n=1 Tax=Sedimenticola selenatireducens TaxID=191960 RepID=UPI00048FE5CC|nr:N-6 DNA methylase [Sedimenticola selenatireducens]